VPGELSDGLVLLRPWTVGDAQWYAQESKDEAIQRFTSDTPTLTAADVAAAIERLESSSTVALLIADALTTERLGNIAVDLEDGVGHLSYWVAVAARGRGVATAAVRLLADQLLSTGRADELRLWTHEENVASQRVAASAGFVRDPVRDKERDIKGSTWRTIAYRRRR
jgi:RimJ/RimL family protein N-acetyltransferase